MTGEFLAGNDSGRDGVTPAAFGGDDGAVASSDPDVLAELHRRHGEAAERLNQPEPALLVISQHMPGHRAADARGKPDRLRLGDQIADC